MTRVEEALGMAVVSVYVSSRREPLGERRVLLEVASDVAASALDEVPGEAPALGPLAVA